MEPFITEKTWLAMIQALRKISELCSSSKKKWNDIHLSVQLEVDCPSKHDDNRMPILDLNVWV